MTKEQLDEIKQQFRDLEERLPRPTYREFVLFVPSSVYDAYVKAFGESVKIKTYDQFYDDQGRK